MALLVLGFSTTLFLLIGVSMGGAWGRCFYALSAVYGVGFFALAAEWFWGRWYAMGIAASGISTAALGLLTNGWNVGLAIWGLAHLLIYAPLLGNAIAARYEDNPLWRQRYGLDEQGVIKLKRAVKGAATALPTLVLYALAPRDGQGASVALLALAGLGLFGLLRLRFWGVALLGLASAWTAFSLTTMVGEPDWLLFDFGHAGLFALGLFSLGALLYSLAPFVRPAYRMLRDPALEK